MDQAVLDALDPAAKVNSWEALIAAPDQEILVTHESSHLIGYVHACDSRDAPDGRTGEVASLYVVPSHWRRGFGSALLRAAERALTDRGHRSILLWVLEANGPARAFYEHFGYAADGAEKRHPRSGLTEVRYRRETHAVG